MKEITDYDELILRCTRPEVDKDGTLNYCCCCEPCRILLGDYFVKTSTVENQPGAWNSTLVEIYSCHIEYDGEEDEEGHEVNTKLGEYTRNYRRYSKSTFAPFKWADKRYAFVSRSYGSVDLMELPSCKIIAEGPNGFCPIAIWVPGQIDSYKKKGPNQYEAYMLGQHGQFPLALVAGCHWGDDSSWKVRAIDIKSALNGTIHVEDVFGRIGLPCKEVHPAALVDVWAKSDIKEEDLKDEHMIFDGGDYVVNPKHIWYRIGIPTKVSFDKKDKFHGKQMPWNANDIMKEPDERR